MANKKRTIQLPKGYMSYSQLQLWLNDQDRYKQLYFDKRDELRSSNRGQEYGKVVATLLENNQRSDDLLTDTAMFLVPKYDIPDKEIETVLPTVDGDINILLRPDSLDSVTKNFLEYKTGRHAWTQKKAQEHLQMHFYAMGIYLEYNVKLDNAKLIWIETYIKDDGTIEPTGRIEEFVVTFTMNSILETMALVSKSCKEIEIAYAQHVPNKELENF